MAEGKKEPWLNYLALTTVIFAVYATLSTFKGGGFSTRSVLNQSHAANQWAYYQAKGMRMEKIVEEIMAHPEKAGEMLVRQEAKWKKS